jgi:hypothetical protein
VSETGAFAAEAADELFDRVPALAALSGYERTRWRDEIETVLDGLAGRWGINDSEN